MKDDLDSEMYICMYCKKECNVTQGTWPQYNYYHEPVFDADLNNREHNEFVCYDCAD